MATLPRRPEAEPALESPIPDVLPRSEVSLERWLEAAFERRHPLTGNPIDIVVHEDFGGRNGGVLVVWGRTMRSIGRFYRLGTPGWAGPFEPVIENSTKVNVPWPLGPRITVGNVRLIEPSVAFTWSYLPDGDRKRFKTILYVNAPRGMLEETRQRLQEFFPDRSFPEDIEKFK